MHTWYACKPSFSYPPPPVDDHPCPHPNGRQCQKTRSWHTRPQWTPSPPLLARRTTSPWEALPPERLSLWWSTWRQVRVGRVWYVCVVCVCDGWTCVYCNLVNFAYLDMYVITVHVCAVYLEGYHTNLKNAFSLQRSHTCTCMGSFTHNVHLRSRWSLGQISIHTSCTS